MSGFRAKRVLVVRLSAVGDVIKSLPAFQVLRRNLPGSFIGWVVEAGAKDVLQGQPGLSELLVFERGKASGLSDFGPAWFSAAGSCLGLLRRIRAHRFDTVIDFQGNAKSAMFALLAGAPLRIGFDAGDSREFAQVAYNWRVGIGDSGLNAVEKNLRLLAAVGFDTRVEGPFFRIAPADADRAESIIGGFFARTDGFVVLHPGTSAFGAYKRWPAEKYAALAAKIIADCGSNVLVTWGSGERRVAEFVARGLGRRGAVPAGKLTIGQLAAVLARARAFVGSDSAPLHLASSVGVPAVALFGPKDPAVHGPWRGRNVVVRRQLACSPCKKRTCERPECMTGITVEEVFEALTRILTESAQE